MLSQRQKDELNRAIVDYLHTNNYKDTLNTFVKEATIDITADDMSQQQQVLKASGTLEKKWTAVVRLQKKIADLEAQLEKKDQEIQSLNLPTNLARFTSGSGGGVNKSPSEWLPRPPEKYTLTGHRATITRCIFHPIYSVIVSCSEDTTIKLWDYDGGNYERTLKGHTDVVQDLAFDAYGKLLASCSADMSIRIWDFVDTYNCIKTLQVPNTTLDHSHNDEKHKKPAWPFCAELIPVLPPF
jgi:platelet-activating factor acetylhydrolase IB subunit alpha